MGIYSKFSHAEEKASAGYYQVKLQDYDINVELTATERCGIQRYTFPKAQAAVILNLKRAYTWKKLSIIAETMCSGDKYSCLARRRKRLKTSNIYATKWNRRKGDGTPVPPGC